MKMDCPKLKFSPRNDWTMICDDNSHKWRLISNISDPKLHHDLLCGKYIGLAAAAVCEICATISGGWVHVDKNS